MSFDNPEKNESGDLATNDPKRGFEVAIVAARFNQSLVDGMLKHVVDTLKKELNDRVTLKIIRVPGSNELPFVVGRLASFAVYDVIIALGVAIAGETNHHEVIANGTSNAFHLITIEHMTPVINGVVVTNTLEEAKARTIGKINRGKEFAMAAIDMINVAAELDDEETELSIGNIPDTELLLNGEDFDFDDENDNNDPFHLN